MHPSSVFQNDDKDEALAFISAHPFATLAINGERGPVTALVPLTIDKLGGTLLGHVARSNYFWQAVEKSNAAGIAMFRGADAYVSPSYYPSKLEHGKTVPTWNYLAVEIRGKISVETRHDHMMPYLTALTDKMESNRDVPWKVDDAPKEYIEKLSRAIVGFSLEINEINFVKKNSQNKSEKDKQGVVQAFTASSDLAEHALALEINRTH